MNGRRARAMRQESGYVKPAKVPTSRLDEADLRLLVRPEAPVRAPRQPAPVIEYVRGRRERDVMLAGAASVAVILFGLVLGFALVAFGIL